MSHSKQKQSQDKLSQIKRNQQTEKKNSAQLLEEARQRENQMTEDMTKIQVNRQEQNNKIQRFFLMQFDQFFLQKALLTWAVV